MIYAVIIAGGKGERFWPLSRLKTPKQLLPITSSQTMIQLTIERIKDLIPLENVLVITNQVQKEEMLRQLPFLNSDQIISEPVGRDSAAAIGLGATLIQRKDKEAVMLVLPADHVIHDVKAFHSCVQSSVEEVRMSNSLLTFGIPPTYPATGYGYLNVSSKSQIGDHCFYNVEKFVEKPDALKAKEYLESGQYFWNSGMFLWKTSQILKEIQNFMPGLAKGLSQIDEGLSKGNSLESVLSEHFPHLEKNSIDFGIMEKAANVKCCESSFDWDDVGSWESVTKHFDSDDKGNVCIGDVKLIDCENMLVFNCSKNKSIASAIGLKDQIFIQTDDAVLSCAKKDTQKVKKLVELLKSDNLNQYL